MDGTPNRQATFSIDSRTVAAARRVEYWREMISSSFVALDCEVPESAHFGGSLRNGALGDIQVSRVVSAAQRVSRTSARIRQNPEDFVLLSFQLRGLGRVAQSDREAVLAPGDFALYDSTRPYRLQFDSEFEQIVLRLPRQLIGSRVPNPERITATSFRSVAASAGLAFDFVTRLSRDVDQLSTATRTAFHDALVDILTATLAEPLTRDRSRRMNRGPALRLRIERFVDHNLGRADLDCRMLADAHGISARYLGKLFADNGDTPSDWIWSRRLERAMSLIEARIPARPSLTQIAYDCGFKDPAHFSRAFKARFGVSPSSIRGAK